MTASAKAVPSSPDARRRMQRIRQKNTSAELALRRELHARGIRYRLQVPVLTKPRRTADVAFCGLHVAVFVDGCFWHGCSKHVTWPKQNAEFWRAKIEADIARDRDTDGRLNAEGWMVVRVWAHEEPRDAADRIVQILKHRRERMTCE
jgi:DNA mismatch endonuclease (patch repair protein)